jgi:hypothetical protein
MRQYTAPVDDSTLDVSLAAATYSTEPSGLRAGDSHDGTSPRFVVVGRVANVHLTTRSPAVAFTQNTVPALSMAPMYTKPLGAITGDA